MHKLTIKQKRVLDTITTFIDEHDYAPTVRELCSLLSLASPSTVKGYLDKLKDRGYIDFEPRSPRTLRILKKVNSA